MQGIGKKRVMRDFAALVVNLDGHFDGQVRMTDDAEIDVNNISFRIKPNAGPYRGGTFLFTMHLTENYPAERPKLFCHTKIYHPNIDTEMEDYEPGDTNICVSLLQKDEWRCEFSLVDAVQAVLFLLYEPNLEDPLSPYFDDNGGDGDNGQFEYRVRQSLIGGIVDDWIEFERNWDDGVIDTRENTNDDVVGNNDTVKRDVISKDSDVIPHSINSTITTPGAISIEKKLTCHVVHKMLGLWFGFLHNFVRIGTTIVKNAEIYKNIEDT